MKQKQVGQHKNARINYLHKNHNQFIKMRGKKKYKEGSIIPTKIKFKQLKWNFLKNEDQQ